MNFENEIVCYVPFLDEYVTANLQTLVQTVDDLNNELNQIGFLDLWHFMTIINEHISNVYNMSHVEETICHRIGFWANNSVECVFSLNVNNPERAKNTGISCILECDDRSFSYEELA